MFDDKFSTVNYLLSNNSLDAQWSRIFKLDREFYLDLEYDQDCHLKTSHFPDLDSEWLDPVSSSTTGLSVPGGASDADAAPGGASPAPLRRSPRLNINSARRWGQAPASVAGSSSVPSGYHEGTKVRKAFIVDQPILQDTWDDVDGKCFCNFSRRDPWDSNLIDLFDPRVLSAKASKYNNDNPSWEMAMNGPFSAEYWKACETELKTLEDEMNVWTLVERTPEMNVLPSTWAFKFKRFPDLLPKKFKA